MGYYYDENRLCQPGCITSHGSCKKDGILVRAEEKGSNMEINFVELSTDMLKTVTLMEVGESDAQDFTMLKDKARITEGDYLENFGFVGMTADGSKQIVVIFDYAICTSGLELEGKNKENSVIKATLEACAAIDGDLESLPVRIYYPELPTV